MIDVDCILDLWMDTDISATNIAKMFGVSKNVIMGIVSRAELGSRGESPATIFDRMAMLDARMDKVLRDTAASLE